MLNAIPIFGWMLSVGMAISMAFPFWICWTVCGIGKTYFYFLPEQYHAIPFWNTVGLFTVVSIMTAFVPKLATTTQNNKGD